MKKSNDELLKSVNSEQTGEESDSIDEEKEDFVSDSAPVPDEIFAIFDAMLEEFGLEGKAEVVKFPEPIAADKTENGLKKQVKDYIARVESNPFDVEAKNNLAYLIRRFKIDTSGFRTSVDLSVPALLEQGYRASDAYGLVNMALYCIEQSDFDTALECFKKITKNGYIQVLFFWYAELWEKEKTEEGALVSYMAFLNKGFSDAWIGIPERSDVEAWLSAIVSDCYNDFLTDDNVFEWIAGLEIEFPDDDEQ